MEGETVLITGANGFLGKHMVDLFLSKGAVVLATDLSADYSCKLTKNYDKFHYFKMDITDINQVIFTFDLIYEQCIFPNTIINNAAINPKIENDNITTMSRLENYDLEIWNKEISVGLSGAFTVTKSYVKILLRNNLKGNIVNIASDLGVIAPDQRLYSKPTDDKLCAAVKPVSYSVIKHGLIGLTKYLATYNPELIRANSISPGGFYNGQDQEFIDKLIKLIPQGRMAELKDIDGVLLLLCRAGSEYITGQNIIIDGGRSIW
jgi:NAD(P)-dependent dehydrogenase (short-subunit alcohol dehydrogenase family)